MPAKVSIILNLIQGATSYTVPELEYRLKESDSDIPSEDNAHFINNIEVDLYISRIEDMNSVFRKIESEYVCIIDDGILLTSENWLTNLLFNYELINNSGIIGISTDTSKQDPMFLLNKEEGHSIVFSSEDGIVEGAILFKREMLYHVGAFGENLNCYQIPHFCLRTSRLGYENYYIDDEFAILKQKWQKGDPSTMQESLEEMKKMRNWYLPL